MGKFYARASIARHPNTNGERGVAQASPHHDDDSVSAASAAGAFQSHHSHNFHKMYNHSCQGHILVVEVGPYSASDLEQALLVQSLNTRTL